MDNSTPSGLLKVSSRGGHFPLYFVTTCVNRVFVLWAICLVIMILRDPFSRQKTTWS